MPLPPDLPDECRPQWPRKGIFSFTIHSKNKAVVEGQLRSEAFYIKKIKGGKTEATMVRFSEDGGEEAAEEGEAAADVGAQMGRKFDNSNTTTGR